VRNNNAMRRFKEKIRKSEKNSERAGKSMREREG
jgi:hypothetical protein